jgi:uncharacterized membrane protein YphA (DoxX/SURF4 family)
MNYLQRMEYWGEAHHPRYLDIIRIALGIFLCIKGVEFANNSALISESLQNRFEFNGFLNIMLVHYVIFAHIVGGFLIAVGLLTRLSCLLQIPILLGALIFVNWNMMNYFSQFILALITLLLLCYFMVIGSGPWSLDRVMWDKDASDA